MGAKWNWAPLPPQRATATHGEMRPPNEKYPRRPVRHIHARAGAFGAPRVSFMGMPTKMVAAAARWEMALTSEGSQTSSAPRAI